MINDLWYIIYNIITPAAEAVNAWFFGLLNGVDGLTEFVFSAIVLCLFTRFILAPVFGGFSLRASSSDTVKRNRTERSGKNVTGG